MTKSPDKDQFAPTIGAQVQMWDDLPERVWTDVVDVDQTNPRFFFVRLLNGELCEMDSRDFDANGVEGDR